MPRCVCGNHYSEHKYLRRHEGSCPKVKERSKRIWSVIKKVNTEESRSKRRHAEWDLAECGESSNLDRFMGRIKRKKPNRGLEAEGGNESFGGPSSSIAHDDLRSMTPPIICGVDVADSRCGSGDAVDANSDCDFHSSLPHMAPSSDTLPPKRIRRRTERAMAMLEDTVPEGPGDLLSDDETTNTTPQSDSEQHPPLRIRIRRVIRSVANKFGLVRIYHGRPSGVPKSHRDDFTADDLHSRPRSHTEHPPSEGRSTVAGIISPYPNISAFLFNRWHWNSGKKTKKGRTEFLEDVIGHKDFKIEDIRGINFDRIDDMLVENPGGATDGNGWRTSAVPIHIPTGKKETKSSRREAAYRQRQDRAGESDGDSQPETEYATGRQYSIPDLHYRNLVDVVKEVCSGAASENFHWHPFEEHWEPPWEDRSTERVYGDLFTSSAFLDADRDLHNLPPEPDCDLPRAIAALMFYSDATHVAQFGQAKLWPIYAYFGNQSKYERGRPSARAGHSVAFLPSLPDSVTDFIRDDPSGKITGPLLAHCRRELFHGCWKIILDEEFLHAYEHGIIVDCGDGVRRRIYPRIFTYSADYPEKVLIATIRDMGQCPCPRCKIKKDEIREFASASDMEIRHTKLRIDDEDRRANVHAARSLIYDKGYVVNSAHVEDLLKGESLVPTDNAFSSRLYKFGFNFYDLMVVDLMHEVELGVWKTLLQHLVRILYSLGPSVVYEFNARFRQVSAFGRSTIRKFPYNVADLPGLAARDYEDILQCCIPCFEGLLPDPHNNTLLDLLYILNYWHSMAKLRMHTDTSLRVFRQLTTNLGAALRYFADETCQHFQTFETDKEYQARSRASARRLAKVPGATSAPPDAAGHPNISQTTPAINAEVPLATPEHPPCIPDAVLPASGKRPKKFNISTPKAHFFPDYADQIGRFGTTDSLSTKVGESRHTRLKNYNNRTNFNNATPQIINIDVRDAVHLRMTHELEDLEPSNPKEGIDHTATPDELIGSYRIASDERPRNRQFLPDLIKQNRGDPAFDKFISRLKTHLLARKRGIPFTGNEAIFDDTELSRVIIRDHHIFSHATASFNYTTYDVRRDQDTINVNSSRCNITCG